MLEILRDDLLQPIMFGVGPKMSIEP